ncbi:MAG: hypothetical protein IKL06_00380 [Lachnospiraceae bacterium]|nr:hypothetical protein [Lachnospiraceae bacterium]
MCIDQRRFDAAKEKIIGKNRERIGIGTLSEKTMHAVLKHYYAPDEEMHEIPIENYVADIYTGTEIIEIQTRAMDRMRKKLEAFLPLYPVTIVYPMPHEKWLYWIDEETGEVSPKRKSPKKGNPYQAFIELYKIRPFLSHPNLRLRLDLIDMEEYRLLNGWSRDKKKGSERYDRIPTAFVEEVCIDCVRDYMQLIPYELPEQFTVKEFAKCAKIPVRLAGTILLIFYDLKLVDRVGKSGKSYVYEVNE